jgi:L-histidine N-alpha-methyltransferase
MIVSKPVPNAASSFAAEVLRGLTATSKALPPKFFYDATGSALFEQITELPEYYLTRTERKILRAKADEIVTAAGAGLTLVELGAGTASKTRILIRALLRRQSELIFYPVDVSSAALRVCAEQLSGEFENLRVRPTVADYFAGTRALRRSNGRKLVLFIGSSIGNYEPLEAGAFLSHIRTALSPGDTLLLGTDMVKDCALLVPAYDDAQGVTAAFNKNVLARINRELGGHFDLELFRHVALWNARCSRIEMHLESVTEQDVAIDALELTVAFAAGERIHTENSYKFTPAMVESILANGGFQLERSWSDPRRWFALHLARVA